VKTALLLVALAAPFLPPPQQESATTTVELIPNPTFQSGAQGWKLTHAAIAPGVKHDTSDCVALKAFDPGTEDVSVACLAIAPAPTDRRLSFSCYARAEVPGQSLGVKAEACRAAMGGARDKPRTNTWQREFPLLPNQWTLVSAAYVLPASASELELTLSNDGSADVVVADVHLVAGEPAKGLAKDLRGPGVIRASAATAVKPGKEAEGTVTFPIPTSYRDQVPLTFDVAVNPPDALVSYRCFQREDELNWMCEVKVHPPAAGASVRWESLVLVGDRFSPALPAATSVEVPDEAEPWTHSTGCVQSDDPAVKAKAEELSASWTDLESYVRKVLRFTSTNQGKPGAVFDTLDASKAMECGGSCTSRANLAAALLRARGIPARTVAHLPTWCGPLYEHWLVEYWHPGAGWVWIESTLGQLQPKPYSLVVINVANPEDEDMAFDEALAHSYVARGAPFLAVHWISDALDYRPGRTANLAYAEAELKVTSSELEELFAVARQAFPTLSRNMEAGQAEPTWQRTVAAALSAGGTQELGTQLRQRAEIRKN
jgi:transglutaminase-like putative cysteine protease